MASGMSKRGDRENGKNQKAAGNGTEKVEHPILFQKYFKSGDDRTYVAQVKQTTSGDHYLVLTAGYHDRETNELRKPKLLVFSENFPAFFRMLHETAQFIRSHPVPEEVRKKREEFWARQKQKPAAAKKAPAGK